MSSKLNALFKPKSIAIIGASGDKNKIGGRPITYLHKIGFSGRVFPINPSRTEIQGLKAYSTILEVPDIVDLAIIAVPASLAMKAMEDCAAKKVKTVVIFSSGFAEMGEKGRELQEKIRLMALENSIRILGPNSLGMFNLKDSVIASFSAAIAGGLPKVGPIGFVTQSGAFGAHLFAMAREKGLGVSYWIATGNEADVDVADCVAYLAQDEGTDIIAIYIEGTKNGEKLKAALKLAYEKHKPVIALKVGSSSAGAKAAASHTGSMVGSDAVFDTVFQEAGVFRAKTIQEFVDVINTLAKVKLPSGNRVGIFTLSGGVGILLADQVYAQNMELPEPSDHAKSKMLEMVPYASVANPIDVTAQIINQPELLSKFMEVVCEDEVYDLMIVFLAHFGLQEELIANQLKFIRGVKERFSNIPMLFTSLLTKSTNRMFDEMNLPVFEDPSETVNVAKALTYLAQKHQVQASDDKKIMIKTNSELSLSLPKDSAVTENIAKGIIANYNIPVTKEATAFSESEAVDIARSIGFPVVLKGMSPQILHKTDAGIIYLNVPDEEGVRIGFRNINQKILDLNTEFGGVLIQEMIPDGKEVIVGTKLDPVFGPIIMVGLGGIYTEILKDNSIRLAPVCLSDAEQMIKQLKMFPLLSGYRGGVQTDIKALAQLLVDISRFAYEYQNIIEEIDLNPVKVLSEGDGVKVVDALIVPRR